MNKIRKQMSQEVDVFIPVIQETYHHIATEKVNRALENEATLRLQLTRATTKAQKFKPFIKKK